MKAVGLHVRMPRFYRLLKQQEILRDLLLIYVPLKDSDHYSNIAYAIKRDACRVYERL